MTKTIKSRQEFKQKRLGFYSCKELAIWLGVSRNSIDEIALRFRLTAIEGLYPEANVWRKIFSINPRHEDDRRILRDPLQGSGWVARRIGVPSSTVRAKIRKGTFEYPTGVQLADPQSGGGSPRSRRWIPCIIEALADGSEPPDFEYIEHGDPTFPLENNSAREPIRGPTNNVFKQIAVGNAEVAQQ